MDLNQVTVPSLDIKKSIEFYKKLGLRLIVEALPHYARFECPEGEATFSVHLVEELPTGDGVYVYFESLTLDRDVAQLLDKEIKFIQLPVDQRWLWREARLKDPDGNTIVLYHAGVNRKNPPWKISDYS